MVNNIANSTTAFLSTEISILQTKSFGLQIIQSLFLKSIKCLHTTQLAQTCQLTNKLVFHRLERHVK